MAEILLVKAPDGKLHGADPDERKKQARFHAMVERLEVGEVVTVKYNHPRNSMFHRKFFALLKVGFDAWDPMRNRKRLTYKGREIEKNFDKFREQVVIAAGFYHQVFDIKGKFTLEAESISFAAMDDIRFEAVYNAVQKVLLEDVLLNYTKADLDEVVEKLMRFTENDHA